MIQLYTNKACKEFIIIILGIAQVVNSQQCTNSYKDTITNYKLQQQRLVTKCIYSIQQVTMYFYVKIMICSSEMNKIINKCDYDAGSILSQLCSVYK